MKMLQLAGILLTLSGVYTQDRNYGVFYPVNPVCAVRGSSVYLPCNYSFPETVHVTQKLWCSMNSNTDLCQNPPYVYNSLLNNDSNYQFIGDDKLNCTLLIHNVQFNYSGVYKFRFITNNDRFTGTPGLTLQVTDVKMSLIRLSGNGTLKQGDSLNLTCDVNCTHTSSQFTWTKDDQRLPESGTVLHFPALTAKDSGKYTCTWETDQTSEYDTISLHVEGFSSPASVWLVAMTTAVLILITLIILGVVINYTRTKVKRSEETAGESTAETQTKPQSGSQVSAGEMLNKEKVTYSVVQKPAATKVLPMKINPDPQTGDEVIYTQVFIKPKKPTEEHGHSEQQLENDSVIYSTMKA